MAKKKAAGRTLPNLITSDEAFGLGLDEEELRVRGLLEAGGGREAGAVDLESPHGINGDGAWTEMRRPRGRIRGVYALIPRDMSPFFRALFSGHSRRGQHRIWASMFDLYSRSRLVLLEVRSRERHGCWFGVFAAGDMALGTERLLTLICSDVGNQMSYDFNESGISGFELIYHGAFGEIGTVMDYREILINQRLDAGWASYNGSEFESGALKRFVRVEVGFTTVDELVRVCAANSIRLNTAVTKLVLNWMRKMRSR